MHSLKITVIDPQYCVSCSNCIVNTPSVTVVQLKGYLRTYYVLLECVSTNKHFLEIKYVKCLRLSKLIELIPQEIKLKLQIFVLSIFPPRRPGFEPGSGHVVFVVDKVALG
jgi:hypothetical protein